jgi:alpha-L-fucosidase
LRDTVIYTWRKDRNDIKELNPDMNRRKFLVNALTFSATPAALRALETPLPGISNANPFVGLGPKRAMALEESNLARTTTEINALLAGGPFQPNWDSLHNHQDADWFREAKFGIYSHWGPVTVGSSFSPGDAEWYGNQMYKTDHPAFEYHKKTFGDQQSIGYKDIIPKFTGEHFDAHRWANVVARSGAKFAGPVAMHHDNFALWNSSLTRWNAVAMGPHRDIVGELAQAYRAHGLKFITSFHHGFAWRYYEPSFAYDGADPVNADLYTEAHAPKAPPSKHFQDRWLGEVYEVLTRYQPDLIYFDFEFFAVITPEYQQRLFATAYDWAEKNHRTISVTQKDRGIHQHTGILDFERGREDAITPYPWLDDTAIGPWFYVAAEKLKTPGYIVGILSDIVAKNGCMLLDIAPKIDGTFPEESEKILLELGDWLRVNGEAIYGTRPYTVYGEGPTHNVGGAGFSENQDKPYTGQDVRYTTKGDALYAIFLGRPERTVTLASVSPQKLSTGGIHSIQVLGSGEKVAWRSDGNGITLTIPASAIERTHLCCALKIS